MRAPAKAALGLALALAAGACTKKPPPIEGALQTRTCGEVTAVWRGEAEDPQLEFRIGDERLPFKPVGDLYPANKSFEIFSPDCAWVLLPQDNYGPYHLVQVKRLGEYLRGGKPFAAIGKPGSVLTDQTWRSASSLEFFASCCGGVEVFRAEVSAPDQLERVFFAAEAPRGIRRVVDAGFEVR